MLKKQLNDRINIIKERCEKLNIREYHYEKKLKNTLYVINLKLDMVEQCIDDIENNY